MKAILTAKRFASVIALLLAIMVVLSACGGSAKDATSSNNSDNGSSSNVDDTADKDTTDDPTTDDPATDDPTTDNNSQTGSQTGNQPGNQPGPQTPPPSGANKGFNNANEGTLYKNAPKGEVHVLMWRNYTKTEQQLVNDYMKKTGVKIKTTVTTEKEYPTKLVSMVSGKNSPDVVCFSSGNFPGLVTKSLQVLDEKTFQLSSDCWNYGYMDSYKINGKYFGVAMPGTWSCEDCAYVTYYNPTILQLCGVQTMPYVLYTQGKWNWDEEAKIAKQVKNSGRGYVGLSLQSNDLFMVSAGTDFASYDGKKFTNLLGSVKAGSLLTQAWQHRATLNAGEITSGWDLSRVQQGQVGLFSAIAYGLYNEGKWFDNVTGGYQKLQAVPMAGPAGKTAYTPIRPKVWGVAKGAKNAAGAAYFLRYFLDISNCNFSSTFYNKQFETVYNKITSSSVKKKVMVAWGVANYVTSNTYEGICNNLTTAQPGNVNTILNSKKGNVQTGINRANKDLARPELIK